MIDHESHIIQLFTPNRALLEVITVKLATHMSAIQEYVAQTLLSHTMDPNELNKMVDTTLSDLIDSGLIEIDLHGGYTATSLSQATVASYLTPEDGLFIHEELRRALKAFVMDGEMHIFYTFAPVWNPGNVEIKWNLFRKEVDCLDESGLRVLSFVGINPALVNRLLVTSYLPSLYLDSLRVGPIVEKHCQKQPWKK